MRCRADDRETERLDRNLSELLQELRVALPGVQVLFAFLLACVVWVIGQPQNSETATTRIGYVSATLDPDATGKGPPSPAALAGLRVGFMVAQWAREHRAQSGEPPE